jgi:hypothetical protein
VARGSHAVVGRSVGVRRSFRRRRSVGNSPKLAGVGGARLECVTGALSPEIGEAGMPTSGPGATVMGGGNGFDLKSNSNPFKL